MAGVNDVKCPLVVLHFDTNVPGGLTSPLLEWQRFSKIESISVGYRIVDYSHGFLLHSFKARLMDPVLDGNARRRWHILALGV